MWLLDHNLPRQLLRILRTCGVSCQAARDRGWAELKNGELVAAANAAGFICILTKDVNFRESASRALKKNPKIAIVLLTLPQVQGKAYADEFLRAWKRKPIEPIAGHFATWP